MKKLSDGLKKILTGFAYEDAGEFLPMREKMEMLGYAEDVNKEPVIAPVKAARKPTVKRIALVSDGRGLGAPLDYIIESCLRQGARIDLLIHGVIDTGILLSMEMQARQAGLDCERIQLGVDAVDGIINYIETHSSVIFLVAIPDDPVARVLIEDVIPKRGGRIPVPLVLIDSHAAISNYSKTAA